MTFEKFCPSFPTFDMQISQSGTTVSNMSFLNGCYPLDPPYIQPPHNVTIKYTFWLVLLKQDERNGPVVLRVNHLECVTSDAAYLKATNIAILGRW